MLQAALFTFALAAGPAPDPELEAKVQEIFDDNCTACHSAGGDPTDPAGIDLSGNLGRYSRAVAVGKSDEIMVKPGDPTGSYLYKKMITTEGIEGDLMPLGGERLPDEQLAVVREWISSLPAEGGEDVVPDGPSEPPPAPKRKPFNGTTQIVLPSTTTLGKLTLQYRIDHRFGRIGTERGAFGLDAGVVMSMGLALGILDGWDVLLRRTNSRKAWELGTKYIPIRQEDKYPVSFGGYASLDLLRDFDIENRVTGNFMLLLSRLWFQRWVTMLTVSYHLRTNHNSRVLVDFDDGDGPVLVRDTRDTFLLGFATTVLLGKKKKWGIELEYLLPIPDGGDPNTFYYRGGDADPGGTRIGAWSLGGSYYTGKHFFQVFITNNREIHPQLAAPGGQTKNPFNTPGVDSNNPFHEANFFLGFNLGRRFTLGTNAKRWKKARAEKKKKKQEGN